MFLDSEKAGNNIKKDIFEIDCQDDQ